MLGQGVTVHRLQHCQSDVASLTPRVLRFWSSFTCQAEIADTLKAMRKSWVYRRKGVKGW